MEHNLKNIGWIGTGVMGAPMAQHLMDKGYKLSIFTRTKAKAESLISNGAEWKTPNEIAATSDVVVLMLGYPQDLQNLLYEHDGGMINHLKEGTYLIDHTTSSPALAIKIFKECAEKGVHVIDAPVSGGDIGAKNGTLVAMCGGDKDAFEKVSFPNFTILKNLKNIFKTKKNLKFNIFF